MTEEVSGRVDLAPADPAGGEKNHAWQVTRVVVLAVAPWVSLGFATPLVFLIAAVVFARWGRIHAVVLWSSTAIYTAVLIVEIVTATNDPDTIFTVCLLILMVIGGLQACAFAVLAARKTHRPDSSTAPHRPVGGESGRPKQSELTAPGCVLGAVVCLVMGILLGVEGARAEKISADLDSRGVTTEATVVAVERKIEDIEPSGGTREWTEVTVAFTDTRGTPVRATREGSDTQKTGDRIQIVYDPLNPAHARWDTAVDEAPLDWFFAWMSVMTSLALLVGAIWAWRHTKKTRGPRQRLRKGRGDHVRSVPRHLQSEPVQGHDAAPRVRRR